MVDGSNIATEGRSLPSLAQLSEAVASFMEEHPDTAITVVVDATFGHRIDKKEVAEFEAGISNNELVAPPAGAIGRGDAFVLSIAQKANASILSNDSFQEFHADYEWLFDEGRLIGGKPVPARRLGVRQPLAGARAGEPQGDPGRRGSRTRGGTKRGDADRGGRRQRQPAGQRTDARAEVATARRAKAARSRSRPRARRPTARQRRPRTPDTSRRRRGQRPDAVPRVRRAPSDRHERQRHRRRRTRRTARTSPSAPTACAATSRCA